MGQAQAKYHHLIPQVYMSAWANASGTLQVEFLNNPGIIVLRNKNKIAGITEYHSIKAGMAACTQEDADKIFSPLVEYIVEIDGRIVTNTLEMNNRFFDFAEWIIKRKNGSLVSKKTVKRDIEKIKIRDVEENWSKKYENMWNDVVAALSSKILISKSKIVEAIYRDYLMKFFVALDWRSIQSNDEFQMLFNNISKLSNLDKIEIPKEERTLPCLKTAEDDIKHNLLLKYYREYLDDKGVIYDYAIKNLENTNFHFFVADGPTYFVTSNNPSFIHKESDTSKIGLMPITPNLLMAQVKCTQEKDKYYITNLTEAEVKKYNKIIIDNADEFIIHPNIEAINRNG